MITVITRQIELVTESCINCGIIFAMPRDFMNRCQELGKSKIFFCPNGHSMTYSQSTKDQEINKLKEERDQLDRSRNYLQSQLLVKTVENKKLSNKAKRQERRLKAGVCPCCNRTFQELADHMKSKHPDYSGKLHEVSPLHDKISKK